VREKNDEKWRREDGERVVESTSSLAIVSAFVTSHLVKAAQDARDDPVAVERD
jgi:hypothetical protein